MRGFTALPYKSGENQTLVYNTRNMNAHTDAQKKYKALETEKVGRDGIKIRLRSSSSATKFTCLRVHMHQLMQKSYWQINQMLKTSKLPTGFFS